MIALLLYLTIGMITSVYIRARFSWFKTMSETGQYWANKGAVVLIWPIILYVVFFGDKSCDIE